MNVNRLFNKLDSVRDLLSLYNLDVLALSETWLTSDISDDEINMRGYTIARKDRLGSTKRSGGGVMLYVRENIPFIMRTDLVADNVELTWIEIKRLKYKPLDIVSVHKPPDLDTAHFMNSLNSGFAKIDSERHSIVLLGDFDIDQLSKKQSQQEIA